jgi:hypothetical protein
LRGDPLAPIGEGFEIRRSLRHGHVLAALAVARRIGLDNLLPRRAPHRRRDLALALTLGLGSITAGEIYTTLTGSAAHRDASTQRIETANGDIQPVHTLPGDLATLTRNTVCSRSACWGANWPPRRQHTVWVRSHIDDLRPKGGKVRFSRFEERITAR